MGTGLQMIVGMLAALVIVCLLIVVHRKQRLVWSAVFVLLGITTVFAGIFIFTGSERKEDEKTVSAEQLEDVYIGLAYGFMEEEAYEEAEIFLGNYLSSGVYDDAYLLARARLYGLQENYDGAEGLYRMLIDRKSKAAGRNELKEELKVIERAKKEADEDAREDAK